jgi:hypothetical protein
MAAFHCGLREADVLVDVAARAAFWILPTQAIDPADVVPGDWKKLTVGAALYVRGDRVSATGGIRARLIVAGGFRSLVGSIESMEPLTESLSLRDFRSGRIHSNQIDLTPIYIVARAGGSAERHLYSGTVGDLKKGDSVLFLACQDGQTGEIHGFALITGFSRDAIVRPAPGQASDWIFKAVGLGGRPLSEMR